VYYSANPQAIEPFVDDTALETALANRPNVLTSRSKRVFDVLGALTLFVLTLPLWICAVLLIRATSPGPAIFQQERIGAGGRRFVLLKFRTMYHGVPDASHREFVTRLIRAGANDVVPNEHGPAFKLTGDPRITAIGRWLRKTSVDELPQLINVIRGDMSLIGPRPPLAYEVSHYERWQLERLSTRPGITGLWQVSGRNRLTHREMCELDIHYIRNWSLLLDLKIAVRTPWVMLIDGGGAS
jgi:lipopolysaccharide/colanic/teichoic acid biosynthesis glycosyltransferase